MDTQVSRITNAHHPIPAEVIEGMDRYHEQRELEDRQQQELVELARPQKDEMEYSASVTAAALQALGIDPRDHQEKTEEWNARRRNALEEHSASEESPEFGPWHPGVVFASPQPHAADHYFWEATGWLWANPPFGGEWQANGGHFRGKYTYDGASMVNRWYGARWLLELHSNRIPASSIGKWRSSPHVGLHGNLLGYVGNGTIFSGDRWSKCWLHTRQTLFHFPFGPSVNDRRIIVERKDVQNLIFIERSLADPGYLYTKTLPGTLYMPSLEFHKSQLFLGYSIWAELEVLFHVQLEGDSLFWINNGDVLLQTFQWPLMPL
ncbi:hypothetical protein GCM10010304_83620 [Streptomyces roseoviolaceus]